MKKQSRATAVRLRELDIDRVFYASCESLWHAWTDPEAVKYWWGPKDFTAPVIRIDLRVGGKYLYCMRGPDGKDYWSTGTFKEIAAPQRLVMTDSFADPKGNVVPATYYGLSPDFPLESNVTLTFQEFEAGKTTLALRYAGVPETDYANARKGWEQSLDKLAMYLASRRSSTTTAGKAGITRLSSINVYVTDQDKARDFYVNKLGFEVRYDEPMAPGQRWLVVAPRDSEAGVELFNPTPESPGNMTWEQAKARIGRPTGIILETDNIVATFAQLKAKGVKIIDEAKQQPFGWWGTFADPDGNSYGVHQ